MFATYWLLGFVIATSLAGEVVKLNYLRDPMYKYYRTDTKSDRRRAKLVQTPQGHWYYLKIDYYKTTYAGEVLYQNIVQVFYGFYKLESLKVREIDTMADPMSFLVDNMKILYSIVPSIPNDPKEDTESPDRITIYYSLTDGRCIKGIYTFVNKSDLGQYYTKRHVDVIVDKKLCVVE